MQQDDSEQARKFFKNKKNRDKIPSLLSKNHQKALGWEKLSVSAYSDKRVVDGEKIARQIHSPIDYDEDTGELTPLAYDDVFKRCLSVDRLPDPDIEFAHQKGKTKAENDRKRQRKTGHKVDCKYIGCVVTDVKTIRSILDVDSGMRLFAVYNTASKNNPHHADVCMIHPAGYPQEPKSEEESKNQTKLKEIIRNQAMRKLRKAFGKIIIENLTNG